MQVLFPLPDCLLWQKFTRKTSARLQQPIQNCHRRLKCCSIRFQLVQRGAVSGGICDSWGLCECMSWMAFMTCLGSHLHDCTIDPAHRRHDSVCADCQHTQDFQEMLGRGPKNEWNNNGKCDDHHREQFVELGGGQVEYSNTAVNVEYLAPSFEVWWFDEPLSLESEDFDVSSDCISDQADRLRLQFFLDVAESGKFTPKDFRMRNVPSASKIQHLGTQDCKSIGQARWLPQITRWTSANCRS